MIGRLLWKEFREGWLVLLIAAIAPWALFSVAKNAHPRELQTAFLIGGWFCSPAAIMLWAASKGSRSRDEGRLPLAHLPANPIIARIVSLVIPLAFSALAGVWLVVVCKPPVAFKEMHMGFGALYMAVAFAGCYFVSAALSVWAGVAAGVAWAVAEIGWIQSIYRGTMIDISLKSFASRSIVGLAVCFVLFFLLAHRRLLRIAQVSSISLLIVVVFGPMVYNYYRSAEQTEAVDRSYLVYSADRSLLMSSGHRAESPGKTTVQFTNNITGLSPTLVLGGEVRPIAFGERGTLYVAQQTSKSGRVHVIAWDGNQKREVARMPAREHAIGSTTINYVEALGSASPDGRYLMVQIGTYGGKGIDTWIVNLRTGAAWIAAPNIDASPRRASWFADKLALSGRNRILTIDLRTMEMSSLRPGVDGGEK